MFQKSLLIAICLIQMQLAISAQKPKWSELLARVHSVETSRSDVIRILGRPGTKTPVGSERFVIREGEFFIFFTTDRCSVTQNGIKRAVSTGAVLGLYYFPRKPFPKSQIPFDVSDFEVSNTEVWGGKIYQNKAADNAFYTDKKGNVRYITLGHPFLADIRCAPAD